MEDIKIYDEYELSGEYCWACSSVHHPVHRCPQYFSWLINFKNLEFKMLEGKRGRMYRGYKVRRNFKIKRIISTKKY